MYPYFQTQATQDPRALQALTQPYTLYGDVPPPRQQMLDLSGIPGGGTFGPMLGMMLNPLMMGMAQNMGYAGLQFGGTQNFYDRFQAQEYWMQSRAAIAQATKGDEKRYYEKLLGIARLTGTIEDENVRRAAESMSKDMGRMGMYIADFMPSTFDELHGIRGSEAMMARKIFSASRYMTDPLDQKLGMSGANAGLLTAQIYRNLFGSDSDLTQMKGFGAGRVGEMFDEMQRRGFLGGALSREASVRAVGDDRLKEIYERTFGKDTSTDPNWKQMALETGEAKTLISKQEATRISDRLKNMVGAVSAMRDIFGDMNKPDAPMAELINGLQTLTQGGMATMSPQQLEMTVRRTQALSKMAGMSMENIMQVMSRGAGLSDQYGLDRQFSITATQGALSFGTAFGNVGGGLASGWKMPTKDELTALDQSLRLTGARSDTANQLNATLRIYDEMGPSLKENSRFVALAKAIKEGRTSYEFGGNRYSVVSTFQSWREMAAEAGVDPEVAHRIRVADVANQEYGVKYNTGDIARRLQRDTDIVPLLQISGDIAFRGIAGGNKELMDALTTRAIMGIYGRDIEGREYKVDKDGNIIDPNVNPEAWKSGRAIGISRTDRADSGKRVEAILKLLRESPEGKGLNESQLRQAVSSFFVDFENRTQTFEPLRGYKGANAIFELHDSETLQLGEQYRARADDREQLASALSGVGRGGMLRRLSDALEKVDDKTSFSKLLVEVVGGAVPKSDLWNALNQFGDKYRQYISTDPRDRRSKNTLLRELAELAKRAQSLSISDSEASDISPDTLKFEAYDTLGLSERDVGKAGDAALSNKLKSVRNRKQLIRRLRQFQIFKKAAISQGLSLTGKDFTYARAEDISRRAGISFEDIKPILEVFRSNKSIDSIVTESKYPGLEALMDPGTWSKLGTKFMEIIKAEKAAEMDKKKAAVDIHFNGPIKLDGSLEIRDFRTAYIDASTGTHRIPLETTDDRKRV